jgi:hypothetical protein
MSNRLVNVGSGDESFGPGRLGGSRGVGTMSLPDRNL